MQKLSLAEGLGRRESRTIDTPADALLKRIVTEATARRYDAAIRLAEGKGGLDLEVQNARAVCLMRSGQVEEAVRALRTLVMRPGSTRMRDDRPVHFKVNFATALLLDGHTGGCLEMLRDLSGRTTSAVAPLLAAIRRWEKSLSWFHWLDWKINRVASQQNRVQLDYEPGEFGVETPPATPTSPAASGS